MESLITAKGGSVGIFEGKVYAVCNSVHNPKNEKDIKPYEGSIKIKDKLDMYESLLHIYNEDYSDKEFVKDFMKTDNENLVEALITGKFKDVEKIVENPDEAKKVIRRYLRLKKYYLYDGGDTLDIYVPNSYITTNRVFFLFNSKNRNERSLVVLNRMNFKLFLKQLENELEGTVLLQNSKFNTWVSIIRKNGKVKIIDSFGEIKDLSDFEKEYFKTALEGIIEKKQPYQFRSNGKGIIKDKDDFVIYINGRKYPIGGYLYKLYGVFV